MNNQALQSLLDGLVDPGYAIRPPRAVSLVHYGPDGVNVATRGRAEYHAQTDGGLEVRYRSVDAGGAPHADSHLLIDDQGRARSSITRLLDDQGQVRRSVFGQYDALHLTAAGTPSHGLATLSANDAQGHLVHQAQMAYDEECYASYSTRQFDADGRLLGRTCVSYGQAQMAGTRLTGGMLAVNHTDGRGTRTYSARSYLGATGVPYQVIGTRYIEGGNAVLEHINSDYGGVLFDARRQVHGGELVVRTFAACGKPRSATALRYRQGQLVGRQRLDLEGVMKVVGPAPLLCSFAPWAPNRAADRSSVQRRQDGSLLQRREDWFTQPGSSGTPRRTLVTLYARDGQRVIRVTDVDYAGAQFDSRGLPVGGSILSTHYQAGVRSTTACIAY
ncbi:MULTISPECIES: hypothetical protein [unclassified Pseudomonas]|uniref:hypothetical protein n=1 Tax=unclassified Pseudomonas TaxID=196821 RepID=UPI000C88A7B9|nr:MULTISPECIES: hypothetical protein [unclassified Pseudomonas]PNA02963.1 hypothetical protein C1X79_00955 [Pseudomonas sp. FW305-42]PNA27693.1 hypothetical protein C1X78_02700 [Pseudomonas sp. MPR-R1B]PNB29589.1 hypothetical protein C1X80_00465 [Pseudomonas sp. DP16D-E2]PNB45146.1 hypothetical protein C1X75_02385 [Pseudomonas sp. FW305-17]PNB63514.1 hypothetical protein C1X77_05755 [Pseudomonas sp. GW531-E2]